MFDPNVASITCGSLDFFESAVDFDDLAFLNLILCMQESDKALAAKMKEIRTLNELKRQITEDINHLNQALARSSTKHDDKDGYVYVEGGLDDPKDPSAGRCPTGEEQREYEDQLKDALNRQNFQTIKDALGYVTGYAGGVATTVGAATAASADFVGNGRIPGVPDQARLTDTDLNNRGLYKRSEVEAKIEELRGRLEDLNTSSSVLMIDLQRLMNKRNEATQLVSNIEAKSHQTAQAIIANLK